MALVYVRTGLARHISCPRNWPSKVYTLVPVSAGPYRTKRRLLLDHQMRYHGIEDGHWRLLYCTML
eukprot:jgi/Psemu1/313576/fgenesh1_kg.1233_\